MAAGPVLLALTCEKAKAYHEPARMRNQAADEKSTPYSCMCLKHFALKLYSLSNLQLEAACSVDRLRALTARTYCTSTLCIPCRTFMSGWSCSTNFLREPEHARRNQPFSNSEDMWKSKKTTASTDSITDIKAMAQGRQMRRLVRLHVQRHWVIGSRLSPTRLTSEPLWVTQRVVFLWTDWTSSNICIYLIQE